MFKLILNPNSHPITQHFDKKVVIIGSSSSINTDLSLPEENLQEVHVKIIEEKDLYTIINVANDPFVTLNGLPFGKKPVNDRDIIQIGTTLIRFEQEKALNEFNGTEIVDTHNALPKILDKAISANVVNSKKQNYVEDDTSTKLAELLMQEENEEILERNLNDIDIQELMRQVEELESSSENSSNETQNEISPLIDEESEKVENFSIGSESKKSAFQGIARASLKDDYLRHLDDEHNPWNKEKKLTDLSQHTIKWSLFIKVILILLFIGAIALGIAYTWVSDQTEEEEVKAARGIADVAMALTYAQVKHIKPQNQNWSDPEFIKNNLNAVIKSPYNNLANFDTHGQLHNTPYILRIYTSSDLSQFLIVAQPAPSLLHWFKPKTSIAVDSNAMEIRKVADVKALNRLLVNANTLDGVNAMEISNLLKQGDLIPLSHLSNKNKSIGLFTPKALGLIRPEAQNLIYNASRYYPFGESLINKSFDLVENPSSLHEISLVQQEITSMSKFSNLVLYSSEGLQYALQAQKALNTISQNEKFLIAYLQFNAKGFVIGSHLLMDDSLPEKSKFYTEEDEEAKGDEELALDEGREQKDYDSPIYLQLISLASAREQALEPISEEMIALLQSQNKSDKPDFTIRFNQLYESYEQLNLEHKKKISKGIAEMYQEHPDISLSKFINYIKLAGLEKAGEENLKNMQVNTEVDYQDKIQEQLKKIEESKSLEELDNQVNENFYMMNLEKIPDPEKLIFYQNETRTKVMYKLSHFLLSPETPLTSNDFKKENRYLLINILKSSWIDDPEAFEFYLNEFDLHSGL